MKRFIKRLFLLFLMSIVSTQAMEVEKHEQELALMHEKFWNYIYSNDLKHIKHCISQCNVPVDTIDDFGFTPGRVPVQKNLLPF